MIELAIRSPLTTPIVRPHCLPLVLSLALFGSIAACDSDEEMLPDPQPGAAYEDPAFDITSGDVRYEPGLDAIIFETRVAGDVASVAPTPAGQVDGAPVLGYVFLTSLAPAAVGFPDVSGTVALAVTSHPDFDDTPLWDEDNNQLYDDDGRVYHSHWVVLVEDERAPAGLAARQADNTELSLLPPTAPMPMYLDSPGFAVIENGSTLSVIVPLDRISRAIDFQADVVTAYMEVDGSGASPLLAVHRIYDSLSSDGSLSLTLENGAMAAESAFPAPLGETDREDVSDLDLTDVRVDYIEALDLLAFSMTAAGPIATRIPAPVGAVADAPVLGYAFPTTMKPSAVGFDDREGTLTLAVTSHPDFDDTPLWDEDLDGRYDNDGARYHVHWVVLVDDAGSTAGLSVPPATEQSIRPPTSPMPMYIDSPGFHAFAAGKTLRVLVPAQRVSGVKSFQYDAVAARLRVDIPTAESAPTLRVEEVFEVLSGDLSLPFTVTASRLDQLSQVR